MRLLRTPSDNSIRLIDGPLHGMYVSSDEEFGGDELEIRGLYSVLGTDIPLTLYYFYGLDEVGQRVEARYCGDKND